MMNDKLEATESEDRPRQLRPIELIVVVIVLLVSAAVFFPWTHSQRESARREQCANNLKRIGLACQSYHDTQKRFPWNSNCGYNHRNGPSPHGRAIPGYPGGGNQWNQFSWIVAAMPYMEQSSAYDKYEYNTLFGNFNDEDLNRDGRSNRDLRKEVKSFLICPSSGHQGILDRDQVHGYRWSGKGKAAPTDYVGNMGHFWGGWKDCSAVPDFRGPPEHPLLFARGGSLGAGTPWVNGEWYSDYQRCNGVFKYWGSIKMSDVLDGTSHTVLAFEDMHWKGHRPTTTRLDKTETDDSAWMCPLGATNVMRNPLNGLNPAWDQWNDRRCHGWSSNHSAGAQAVLCDGAVAYYPETIEHITRYSLAVRNDGYSPKVRVVD